MGSVLSGKQQPSSDEVPDVANGNGNGVSSAKKKLKVAIVGGGPGGLATAIALSKIPDVDVHVYEKDKVLREVGAGINIGPNSWNVLELLGVADSLATGHQCNTVLNMCVPLVTLFFLFLSFFLLLLVVCLILDLA